MANEQKPQNDWNAPMQIGAEQISQQFRSAIDMYFAYLQQSVASIPSGGNDVGGQLKSYAERNLSASHRFLTEVSQAKDFAELMGLQTEFMQEQFSEFARHMQSFGGSAASAVNHPDPTEPPRK